MCLDCMCSVLYVLCVLCIANGHEIARASYRKYAYLFDSLHRRYFWFRLIAFVVNFAVALQAVIVTDTITRVFSTAVWPVCCGCGCDCDVMLCCAVLCFALSLRRRMCRFIQWWIVLI